MNQLEWDRLYRESRRNAPIEPAPPASTRPIPPVPDRRGVPSEVAIITPQHIRSSDEK